MTLRKSISKFLEINLLLTLLTTAIGSAVPPSTNDDYAAEIPQDLFFTAKNFQDLSDPSVISDEDIKHLLRNIVPSYFQDFLLNLNPTAIYAELPELNVSATCVGHTQELLHRLRNTPTLRNSTWALHMLDSWGKIPEGFLTGHVNSMGDFDECYNINVNHLEILYPNHPKDLDLDEFFRGQFCNLVVLPSSSVTKQIRERKGAVDVEELWELIGIQQGALVYPSTTVCLPSSCNLDDVNKLTTYMFAQIGLYSQILSCDVKEDTHLNTGDWAMIGILGVLGLLIFVGTMIDGCLARNADPDKPKRKPGTGVQVLVAFSLITNIRKWQNVGPGGGENFGCLHGLRFMSTLWVILAHTWFMVIYVPWWNMVDVKLAHKTWTVLTMLNATVAVDTFFVMGGMLVSYNLLKTYAKTGGQINYIMYVVHRYLRLTPTYAILVGIMATIFPLLGNGPYWGLMNEWGQYCKDHWWTNLLYINNLVYSSEICQAEAWYLSDDMQFYIFTPLLVYPLWKFKVPGKIILGVLTILSIAAPGLHVQLEDRPVPTIIGSRSNQSFYADVYIKPWTRVQTYFVGMWLGYLLFKTRGKKIKLAPPVVMLGWVISTGIALAVLYGIAPWFDPLTPIPQAWKVIYASFHRVGWAISISWIIFACINGYGGYINNFLSWTPFIPLGRLSFTTYLVSLHVQTVLHLTIRQPLHFSSYIMTNFFFAHVIMSLVVGFVCTICFESPFIQLEKLLFGGNQGPRPAEVKPKPPSKRYGIFYNTTDSIINGLGKEDDSNNNNNSKEVKASV
ncbi:unnamed protein product [Allacma fusca]|uniref:Nose resistant-to-fluoxetine protein N-terminal domain-containing protein n=1 Tax=Allacma fusca TaxID=39272 RepID=A0A8J2P780_9HEXA|nr:unnamed protein product [Allacma fusca]